MQFSPEELALTAKEFHLASKDLEGVASRLDARLRRLEDTWSEASQQVFYQQYREWRHHIGGMSLVLDAVAKELQAIADRFAEADV